MHGRQSIGAHFALYIGAHFGLIYSRRPKKKILYIYIYIYISEKKSEKKLRKSIDYLGQITELNAPARGGRGLNCPLPPACIPLPCTLNDLAKGGKGAVVLLFPACIRLPYVQQNAADAPTGRSTRVGPPPCYDIGIRTSVLLCCRFTVYPLTSCRPTTRNDAQPQYD